MTTQIYLNENMRKLWWGTQMEKLPRSPMWGQWKPYMGGDMTLTCLFCGVGRRWWGPSWLSMATGALSLDQESSTDNGQSASCPFSFVGGWGRLCEPCDAYLGSTDLCNDVIREVESLWYNYLCILGPLFSWRMTGEPHASYVVGTAVVRREARCRLLCGCPCPSPAVRMGADRGRWALPGRPSHGATKEWRREGSVYLRWGLLTCTRTYTHIFVMTKPAVFPLQFILVDNQLDQFQGLILSRRGRGVSLFGMRLLHSPKPISSHLLIYSSLFYVDTLQYFLPNRKELSCVTGLSKTP